MLTLRIDDALAGTDTADVLAMAARAVEGVVRIEHDVLVELLDATVCATAAGTGFGWFRWSDGEPRIGIAGQPPEGVSASEWSTAIIPIFCHEVAHYEQWRDGRPLVEDGVEERTAEIADSVYQCVIAELLEQRKAATGERDVDDAWTEIVSLKARNAALERVAEAAREWRDMRTRLCPQSMDRVEKHWQRTQEAVAEVDAALDALDVAEAREQVARGETHTGDDLREALGVDERWEEG